MQRMIFTLPAVFLLGWWLGRQGAPLQKPPAPETVVFAAETEKETVHPPEYKPVKKLTCKEAEKSSLALPADPRSLQECFSGFTRREIDDAYFELRVGFVNAVERFAPSLEKDQVRAVKDDLVEMTGTSAYWYGTAELQIGDKRIPMEAIFNSYNFLEESLAGIERRPANEPYLNMKLYIPSDDPSIGNSMSTADGLRLVEGGYYYGEETYNRDSVGDFLTEVLIPLPMSRNTAVYYMSGKEDRWQKGPQFRWVADTREQYVRRLDEKMKKLNEKAAREGWLTLQSAGY